MLIEFLFLRVNLANRCPASAEGVAIVDNATGDAFKIGRIHQDAFSHIKNADELCREMFSRMLYKDTITKFTKISEIIKNGFVNACYDSRRNYLWR